MEPQPAAPSLKGWPRESANVDKVAGEDEGTNPLRRNGGRGYDGEEQGYEGDDPYKTFGDEMTMKGSDSI